MSVIYGGCESQRTLSPLLIREPTRGEWLRMRFKLCPGSMGYRNDRFVTR